MADDYLCGRSSTGTVHALHKGGMSTLCGQKVIAEHFYTDPTCSRCAKLVGT